MPVACNLALPWVSMYILAGGEASVLLSRAGRRSLYTIYSTVCTGACIVCCLTCHNRCSGCQLVILMSLLKAFLYL